MKVALFVSCSLISAVILVHGLVHELTDSDFDSRLKGNNALVMFFSPNCGHCTKLKPVYNSLSKLEDIVSSGVLITSVDCTAKGHATCQKYGVNGYPTVKYISHVDSKENVVDYDGDRQLADLKKFVLLNSRPALVELSDEKIADFIISTTTPVVVGFFTDANSKLFIQLLALAKQNIKYYSIGYTFSQAAAQKYGQIESLVLYRQQQYKSPLEECQVIAKSDTDVQKFLSENKFSIVEVMEQTNEHEFAIPRVTAYIPIDPVMQKSTFRRLRNAMLKIAKENTDISFTIAKTGSYKEFINTLAPTIRETDVHLVAFSADGAKYKAKDVGKTSDNKGFESLLSLFVADFKKGNVLEKFVKSDPIPESNNDHVKVVVGKTFDSIVLDEEKDVLIKFYAPWCGHCKKLAPIFDELAEILKDEEKLVIAKMDSTTNEGHKDFVVEGFPTIYLAKAHQKSSPIQYSGKRDVASMIDWLKEHASNPIKYDKKSVKAEEL